MQADTAPETLVFGPFTLDADARALSAGGQKLALSSRAFDILMLLLTHRDRVVSKDEIIATVWRGVSVEENNLAVQVSALRRTLAEHSDSGTMILTVPGQGYRFVGRVSVVGARAANGEGDSVPPEPSIALLPSRAMISGPLRPRILAVTAGAVAIGALALMWITWRAGPAPSPHREAPRLSLAVLPFRNLGDDTKQNYLADAISDDLTTDLSHLPGSVVIARASSDSFKGRAIPAQQIGQALNVRYLLEGSLRGEDGIFRINAQLIDAATGAHLWADRFDVSREKISDAQSAIVHHIAGALNVTLVAIEGERSLHERPNDPDALDLYFRARSIRDRATKLDELVQAQSLLEKAIVLQPGFVDALTDLGLLLLTKQADFDDPDDSRDFMRAKAVIVQAVKLAPKNTNALTAYGALLSKQGDLQEGEASYQAALTIDPSNVIARSKLAAAAWRLGKPQDTIAALTDVLRLDPQGPSTKPRLAMLGMAYFIAGNWHDSIETLMRSLAGDVVEPGAGVDRLEWSHIFLIAAYDKSGEADRARREYAIYNKLWPNRSVWHVCSYFSKAQSQMPGFDHLKAGLLDAGMPNFSPTVAGTVRIDDTASPRGDYDPAPGAVPGATTIQPAQLLAQLHGLLKPIVIDVGVGAALIPGARWISHAGPPWDEVDDVVRSENAHTTQPIAVMGTSGFGWDGHDAAQHLSVSGKQPVLWLRGGEEAWAEAGYEAEDRRQ